MDIRDIVIELSANTVMLRQSVFIVWIPISCFKASKWFLQHAVIVHLFIFIIRVLMHKALLAVAFIRYCLRILVIC